MAITYAEVEELSKRVGGYLEALYQTSGVKLEDINLPTSVKSLLQRCGCKDLGDIIGEKINSFPGLKKVEPETLQETLKVLSEQGLVVADGVISFGDDSPILECFVRKGGFIVLLDMLDPKFFVKYSPTMNAIARDVAKYYDKVVTPKLNDAKNDKELEEAMRFAKDTIIKYQIIVDEKREENNFERKKANAADAVSYAKTEEIIKHHHKEFENPIFGREEGHNHNPFGGRGM